MTKNQNHSNGQPDALVEILRKACKKIAPVWPLENFVAVNPYLGLADLPFEQAAERLAKVGNVEMTLPISFYLQALHTGKIKKADIATVLAKKGYSEKKVEELIRSVKRIDQESQNPNPMVQSLTDVASELYGRDWNRFLTDRITSWAAVYFDEGQVAWKSTMQNEGIFTAWHREAQIDRTPEVIGLSGFRKMIKKLPEQPLDAAWYSLKQLDIPEEALDLYLHRLLMRVGGWSAYVARIDWDNELYGDQDGALIEFLCILICWEACLFHCLKSPELQINWREALEKLTVLNFEVDPSPLLAQKLLLQEAYDLAGQRAIIEQFKAKTNTPEEFTKTKVQAIFCIDVRSEVFRRNLEMVAPEVATLGFAGFFAFPVKYIPIGHEQGQAQCPVLLPTGPVVKEEISDQSQHALAVKSRQLKHQVDKAWKSFKMGAISCFSFVGPVGLAYLPKLFTDTFGLTRPVPHPEREGIKPSVYQYKSVSLEVAKHGHEVTGIPLEEQVKLAKSALQAMSLTEGFARLVLIVGHGSNTVNNPYATGLDCGACGGHSGEANARVAATVLNNEVVREYLKKEGIAIPEDTFFLACQHDTTTDEVSLFNADEIPTSHQKELSDLKQRLQQAGQLARRERALRLQIEQSKQVDAAVIARSKDWSQVRPEWGLAGCSAFVVAPRGRTQGLDLKGRSFLHSYEWKKDHGFKVLELIMTAPMVVTSWISLQYYASTVDNLHYGSGNKTLHNITGGIGVLEGYAGDLRVGLPWQSVHDGKQYQHEPLKLNVIIEAPLEAMNNVLEKHPSVRNLCDNSWLHLLAMDEKGQVSHRYAGDLQWEALELAYVS